MEHEVFVPFPAGRLREALADPVRVARAVPGLQQDASAAGGGTAATDTGPSSGSGRDAGAARVAGRLKVRVAGHTITYRGAFSVTAQDHDAYAVEGDATEVRGGGAVKLALTLRLLPADGGTTLVFGGTASGDGRVAELPRDAVSSTGLRLLTRFTESLTTDLAAPPQPAAPGPERTTGPEPGPGPRPEPGPAPDTEPAPGAATGTRSEPGVEPRPGPESVAAAGSEAELQPGAEPDVLPEAEPRPGPESQPGAETAAGDEARAEPFAGDDGPGAATHPGVEADVSAHAGDPLGEDDEFDGEDFVEEEAVTAGPGRADAMAEAAHARRTMIGRSAEEVDHAPPRGRYAPVPPPEATAARATLRWAAPAAALALASAIALSRALRKRR
ncbi:carbon monoxide dehydrogenase [Streptomyces sp. NPDC127038]|uniref:carbon monoxide dehydrogenase n=1 Tax=Streptomyces sp. NPDC127038 TaxID=3347114 RepID=UPI003664A432